MHNVEIQVQVENEHSKNTERKFYVHQKFWLITVLVFDLVSHMLLNLLYLQPIYYTGFGLYRISFKDI